MSTFLRRQSDQERVWGYRDEMGNSCASEMGAVLDDMGDSLGVGSVLWAVCWFSGVEAGGVRADEVRVAVQGAPLAPPRDLRAV
jgi:hypothetical protein